MKKKKILFTILAILIAALLLIVGAFVIKENTKQDKPITQNPVIVDTEIPKESGLNDIKLSLISAYHVPYKNVDLNGNSLIDGSYAKRTVFVFTITGMEKLNTCFRTLRIFQEDKELTLDKVAYQYGEDEVIFIAACDNQISTENLIYQMTVIEPKTGEKTTFTKELEEILLEIKETVKAGNVIKTSDTGYWHRLANTGKDDRVPKNGKNGAYYEYTRTLNFISFGDNNDINIEDIKIETDLTYKYDVSFSFAEKNNGEYKEYNKSNSTTEKQMMIVFRVYTPEMTDKTNSEIAKKIDMSYFIYNNQKITITDGEIKEELRN